jgi:hypothetical protein
MTDSLNVAIIPSSSIFLNDELFQINKYRDDCLFFFRLLKEVGARNGLNFHTLDKFQPSEIDVLIVYRFDVNVRKVLSLIGENKGIRLIHIMHEPPVVVPMHALNLIATFPFDLQYALNDDMADRSAVVRKICYGTTPFHSKSIPFVRFEDKKFMATIAGAKSSNAVNELYSKRMESIRFFSSKATGFDLFGIGWDRYKDENIRKIYFGPVENKKDVLKNYKFTLCFENTKGCRGYITEKIFDCFEAGTVPIYYGAPNVEDYIPKDCFIDFRDFKDYEELYGFLCEMPGSIYQGYLLAVKEFIETESYRKSNAYGYVDTLLKGIEEVSGKVVSRNAKEIRMGLLLGVLKNSMFYLSHLKSTRRYIFSLLTPFSWIH